MTPIIELSRQISMSNQQLAEQFAEQFVGYFQSACVELFRGFDCEIQPIDSNLFNAHEEPYARIDAGCAEFEIEIYLCLPYTTLLMTHPMQGLHNTIPEQELEDWLSEMSNMLMGKLKRTFLAHGITLKVGLPDFSIGYPLDARQYGANERFILAYETDHQAFETGITIEFLTENLQLTAQQPEDNSVADGNIEFF